MPDVHLLALARHHQQHYGSHWWPYAILGRSAAGLYVETVYQPLGWDWLARRWPLQPGEILVRFQGEAVQVLRTREQAPALAQAPRLAV